MTYKLNTPKETFEFIKSIFVKPTKTVEPLNRFELADMAYHASVELDEEIAAGYGRFSNTHSNY